MPRAPAGVIAIAAVLCLGLAACGGSTSGTGASTAPGTTAAAAAPIVVAVADGKVTGGGRKHVTPGQAVTIRVSSDVADEVHVHGYDLKAKVAPDAPATVTFVADIPGIFVVELESRSLKLLDLVVQ